MLVRMARLTLSRTKSTSPRLMFRRNSTSGFARLKSMSLGISHFIMIVAGHDSVSGPGDSCCYGFLQKQNALLS